MANSGNITLADLQGRFSAAGVYFVERDGSQAPAINSTGPLRLVFGFSRTGLFNTPVYIEQGDTTTAEALFGPADKTLERRGSFFHRSLGVALEQGPVLALNLLKLTNEVDLNTGAPTANADVASYASFSCDPLTANPAPKPKLLASFFNKERFWQAAASYLLATRSVADQGQILNIANLSQTPLTFLIRKSTVKGYDVTARDWYASVRKEIPAFVRPGDLISDYFVDVIAVVGDYSAARFAALAQDPVFGQFFDTKGLKADKLEAFLARPEVSVKALFTGSLIPNFRDAQDRSQYLEDVMNQRVRQTNILCAIDRASLDALGQGTGQNYLDLVGHRLLSSAAGYVTDAKFLSYSGALSELIAFYQDNDRPVSHTPTNAGFTANSQPGKITVTVTSANTNFPTLGIVMEVGSLVTGLRTAAGLAAGVPIANPVLRVSRVYKTASQIVFDLVSPFKDGETVASGSFVTFDPTGGLELEQNSSQFVLEPGGAFYIAESRSDMYRRFLSGSVQDGDTVTTTGGDTYYLKFEETIDVYRPSADRRSILTVNFFADAELTIPVATADVPAFGETVDGQGLSRPGQLLIQSQGDGLRYRATVATQVSSKIVRLPIAEEPNVKSTHYLQGLDEAGEPILTRILSIKRFTPEGQSTPTQIEITTAEPIRLLSTTQGAQQIERLLSIPQYFKHFAPTYLPGFKLQERHLPNGTNSRMKEICSVMTSGALFNALVDPEMITFRYLVDTFNGGLEPQSKRALASLCRTRQRALGLLNAPSPDEFRASANPRFTSTPTPVDPLPVLETRYILAGGNVEENPEFLYTMPEEADGASQVGFFFPNLRIQDNGGDVTSVPPAAHVSNNFVQKFKSGNPYLPVAGTRRGQIAGSGILGTDYALDRDDRGNLEKKGINPLWQKANGQILIYGDETGYKTFNSALNNLSARDTLITIEIDKAAILEDYVFEYNDDSTRSELLSILTNYFSGLRDGYRAITSFELIFDRTNNPDFVTRENAAIVDAIVTLPDIAKKFVARITVRKGSQTSVGGFTVV